MSNNVNLLDNSQLQQDTVAVQRQPMDQVSPLDQKINDLFDKVIGRRAFRASGNDRLAERQSKTFTHTSSRGEVHAYQYSGPLRDQAELLMELTIDMKYLIVERYDIDLDPRNVKDFHVHFEDFTCTFTDPRNGRKIIVPLKEELDPNIQEFRNIYFKAARPFFRHRNRVDRNHSILNGKTKNAPNETLVKAQAQDFIDTKEAGFKRAQKTLFAHSILSTDAANVARRNDLLQRYTFCHLMHKELVNQLDAKIKEKKQLSYLTPQENQIIDKEKLKVQINALESMKDELDKMDYFAPSLVLCHYPKITLLSEQEIYQEELDKRQEIEQSKLDMEGRLRNAQEFNLANDKTKKDDPAQHAEEERYIHENCLGLFNLTFTSQLASARKDNGELQKSTIENIFVRDAVLYNPDLYAGEGFKHYFLPKVDREFRPEVEGMIEEAAHHLHYVVREFPKPDLGDIQPVDNQSMQNPSQDYLRARLRMERRVQRYVDQWDEI